MMTNRKFEVPVPTYYAWLKTHKWTPENCIDSMNRFIGGLNLLLNDPSFNAAGGSIDAIRNAINSDRQAGLVSIVDALATKQIESEQIIKSALQKQPRTSSDLLLVNRLLKYIELAMHAAGKEDFAWTPSWTIDLMTIIGSSKLILLPFLNNPRYLDADLKPILINILSDPAVDLRRVADSLANKTNILREPFIVAVALRYAQASTDSERLALYSFIAKDNDTEPTHSATDIISIHFPDFLSGFNAVLTLDIPFAEAWELYESQSKTELGICMPNDLHLS